MSFTTSPRMTFPRFPVSVFGDMIDKTVQLGVLSPRLPISCHFPDFYITFERFCLSDSFAHFLSELFVRLPSCRASLLHLLFFFADRIEVLDETANMSQFGVRGLPIFDILPKYLQGLVQLSFLFVGPLGYQSLYWRRVHDTTFLTLL